MRCLNIRGGHPEVLRFLGTVPTARLYRKATGESPIWEGRRINGTWPVATIHEVRPVGMLEVVAMQTSTRTFIAEGMLSHNCITNNLILDTRPQFNPWQWMPYHGSSQGTLPPCDIGADGKLITRRAYWCVTTGRASSLTKRSWLGLATGWDDAPEVRVWFLGTNPDGTPNYGLPAPPTGAPPFPGNGIAFKLTMNARQWWEAPDGTDQIAVEYRSEQPIGWEIEKEPR